MTQPTKGEKFLNGLSCRDIKSSVLFMKECSFLGSFDFNLSETASFKSMNLGGMRRRLDVAKSIICGDCVVGLLMRKLYIQLSNENCPNLTSSSIPIIIPWTISTRRENGKCNTSFQARRAPEGKIGESLSVKQSTNSGKLTKISANCLALGVEILGFGALKKSMIVGNCWLIVVIVMERFKVNKWVKMRGAAR